MIDGLIAGLLLTFSWPTIGYLLLGVVLGMWIGAVPGLGGAVGLAVIAGVAADVMVYCCCCSLPLLLLSLSW